MSLLTCPLPYSFSFFSSVSLFPCSVFISPLQEALTNCDVMILTDPAISPYLPDNAASEFCAKIGADWEAERLTRCDVLCSVHFCTEIRACLSPCHQLCSNDCLRKQNLFLHVVSYLPMTVTERMNVFESILRLSSPCSSSFSLMSLLNGRVACLHLSLSCSSSFSLVSLLNGRAARLTLPPFSSSLCPCLLASRLGG